jgi:hypothetical protein
VHAVQEVRVRRLGRRHERVEVRREDADVGPVQAVQPKEAHGQEVHRAALSSTHVDEETVRRLVCDCSPREYPQRYPRKWVIRIITGGFDNPRVPCRAVVAAQLLSEPTVAVRFRERTSATLPSVVCLYRFYLLHSLLVHADEPTGT